MSANEPSHPVLSVFELTLEGGETLVLNGNQLLLTPRGMRKVSTLVAGSVVLTTTAGRDTVNYIRAVH